MDTGTDTGSAAVDTTTSADTGTGTTPAAPTTDWQAEAEKWKALSRKHEKQAKDNADAASAAATKQGNLDKVLAALGMETGTKAPDVDAITAQLAAAQAATVAQHRENAVLRAAGRLGADGDALLDSRAFLATVAELDPADTAGINAAIAEAVKANPRYATTATPATPAAPPAPTRSTATSFEGAPGGQRQWTADDVAKASPQAMSKALKDGLLKAYLSS